MIEKTTFISDPTDKVSPTRQFIFDHSYWSHDGFRETDQGHLEAEPGSKYTDQVSVSYCNNSCREILEVRNIHGLTQCIYIYICVYDIHSCDDRYVVYMYDIRSVHNCKVSRFV